MWATEGAIKTWKIEANTTSSFMHTLNMSREVTFQFKGRWALRAGKGGISVKHHPMLFLHVPYEVANLCETAPAVLATELAILNLK